MKYMALSLFLALGWALSAADLTGKWEGNYDVVMSDGQAMKGKVVMTLTQTGTEFTGTAGSEENQMKVVNGKVDGDHVTFDVDHGEGPRISFDLKLVDEHLRGTGKGEGDGNKINIKLDLARAT